MAKFPRTTVAGKSLPRLIMGTNWVLGYSHKTTVYDEMINKTHASPESISEMARAYLEFDIDAVMGPPGLDPKGENFIRGIEMAEEKTGKPITRIWTPILNMGDSPEARKEAEAVIKLCKKQKGDFCLPHHSSVEELVNKHKQTIDRLPDYLKMIRDNDMIPGLSAHMPELIVYSDANGYDVETYIQIYNCLGFLMQVEIEYIHNVIWNAKKPVMTIKAMAAGRVTPFVGLNFSFNTLREKDMVVLGAYKTEEVYEDVEIALAAIERRKPDIEGRSSPNKTAVMR